MKVNLSFEVFDKYIKVRASGGDPVPEIGELFMTVKKFMEENNRTRILVDAIDLPDMQDMDKFNTGELTASLFGDKFKIALLRIPEHINKFTENVAVNRGARLFITSNEAEAIKWLLD